MRPMIAALVAAGCLLAGPAPAQSKLDDTGRCLAHRILVDYLARAFAEQRIATAALDEGQPVELYMSRRGTWTLVEVRGDGQGCIHAYGEQMHLAPNIGEIVARRGAS